MKQKEEIDEKQLFDLMGFKTALNVHSSFVDWPNYHT